MRGAADKPSLEVVPGGGSLVSEADRELLQELEDAQERAQPSYDDTLLKDGEIVRVRFLRVEVATFMQRPRWMVHFVITEPGHALEGATILRPYNAPTGRRLARSHMLNRDWVDVTGRRPPPLPKAKHRILDALFKGCELHARTRRVRQTHQGVARDERAQYSVIDGFGGEWPKDRRREPIASGSPLVCRGRPRPRPLP